VIFIACSIPRSIPDQLKRERGDVIWLGDRFPLETKDQVWLREAGRQGWMVISHDKNIRALRESGCGCFILAYRDNLSKDQVYELIVSALDEMVRRFDEEPRPFLYTVTKNLDFKEYVRNPPL
jgi:hypothetical protein